MITDKRERFMDAQTLTTSEVSDSSLDLQEVRDISRGEVLKAMFIIGTALTGTMTSATLEIVQADNAALSTNVEVVGSRTELKAALIANAQFLVYMDRPTTRRYLGARFVATGGTVTAGTATAFLVDKASDTPV